MLERVKVKSKEKVVIVISGKHHRVGVLGHLENFFRKFWR